MANRYGLVVNLAKLEDNARRTNSLCDPFGIEIVGVTKGVHSTTKILEALAKGGVRGFADSRIENIVRLRRSGFRGEMTLIRIPRVTRVDAVARYADVSVNSDLQVLRALSRAATRHGAVHRVVLMIDVGDLREGVLPEQAPTLAKQIAFLPGLEMAGIGTNIGCFGGVLPTEDNLGGLVALARTLEMDLGRSLAIVSGGGTSSLALVEQGRMPRGITQLRIGEALLLGQDTSGGAQLRGFHQDAFILRAEVIEVSSKPSVPVGVIGPDAFGETPHFVDRGTRRRAILAVGKADVSPESLIPLEPGIEVMGASSDHTIVDIEDFRGPMKAGDVVEFRLKYPGLLGLAHSQYIPKHYVRS